MELVSINLRIKVELSETANLDYNAFIADSIGAFRIDESRVDIKSSVLKLNNFDLLLQLNDFVLKLR